MWWSSGHSGFFCALLLIIENKGSIYNSWLRRVEFIGGTLLYCTCCADGIFVF